MPLALVLGLSAPLAAQPEIFGTTNNVTGVVEKQLNFGFGNPADDVQWGTRDVSIQMKIEVRYSLSKLVGEPVWGFVPRYEYGSGLTIDGRHSILRRKDWGDDRVELQVDGETSTLEVSANIFDKLRLRSFYFRMGLGTGSQHFVHGQHRSAHFNMPLTGITGKPGEWGWDVPGSPAWNRALLHDSKDLIDGHRHAPNDYFDAKTAKKIWNGMMRAAPMKHANLFGGLHVYRLKFGFSDLMAAIEKVRPGATRHLYEVRERDWSESREEWQLRSLIQGVQRDLATRRDPNGGVLMDKQLRRRISIVEKAMQNLAGPEHGRLVTAWGELQQEIAEAPLQARILLVGRSVAETMTGDVVMLPQELVDEADRIQAEMDSGCELSLGLRQRWEEIQRILELSGGMKRTAYVFAVATTAFYEPERYRGPVLVLKSETAKPFFNNRAEERAWEREQERKRRAAKARQERKEREKAERERIWRQKRAVEKGTEPDPARTDVHRVMIPTEWTTQEIDARLREWAAQQLARSQNSPRKIETYNVVTNYQVHSFRTIEEAEKSVAEMRIRVVRAKPPVLSSKKPAKPK